MNFHIKKDGFKVVHDGTGLDEIFGGYEYHHLMYLNEIYLKSKKNFQKQMTLFCKNWGYSKKIVLNKIETLNNSLPKTIDSYDLINNCEVNDKTLSFLDKPKQYKFNNWKEFHEKLNELPYDNEGFILYNKNKQMTKYVNPKFNLVKKLKGNTNDMLYQCIVLHKYGQNTQFLTYYPEYKETFTDIQKSLYKFVNSIYTFYVTKYINKQTVTVNEEIETILNHLHLDYLNTKIKINKKIIMTKIIGYSPKRIYNLLQPTSQ